MPIIRANTQIVTQINVFTVPEGGQQALIDFLIEAATFASTMQGVGSLRACTGASMEPGSSTMRRARVWKRPNGSWSASQRKAG
jgi:hypothetical protein